MKLIIIAWRNLWRNKKRTILTVASVVFAILFAVMMRSQQLGMYSNAINNVTDVETGHIQIQGKGFNETSSVNDAFVPNDSLYALLENDKRIKKVISRLNTGGIASSGSLTKETMVMGMEVSKEGNVFARNISAGTMIDDASDGVVIGETLANYLRLIDYEVSLDLSDEEGNIFQQEIDADSIPGLKIGDKYNNRRILAINKTPIIIKDSVTILGGGYHGATAAGVYKVAGIVKLPLPDMNKRLIIMNLKTCQDFVQAPGVIATINVNLKDPEDIDDVYASLRNDLDLEIYDVFKWEHLKEELVQQIESDNKSGLIFMFILYLIIGFGILGTIIMMTNERKKEFGIMIAVGMKKWKLSVTMMVESFFIAIMGSALGIAVTVPSVLFMHYHPIPLQDEMAKTMEDMGFEAVMPFAADADIFTAQIITVLIMFSLASLYTLNKIRKMEALNSIRG